MEIFKSLRDIMDNCPGASTLFLTDKDGVVVACVGEEVRARQSLISSHYGMSDQTTKLEMGPHQASVYYYEHIQMVVLAVPPLTAFVIASPTANTGQLMKLREKLEPLLQLVETAIPGLPGGQRA